MEDDNALDIIKWLFKDDTKVDFEGILIKEDENGVGAEWMAKLRGNLLALKPLGIAAVPLLFVCEKIFLEKCEEKPRSFYLKYGNERILFTVSSEKEVDDWMVKLATCSHQMAQAELEQTMHSYYAETTQSRQTSSKTQSPEIGQLTSYFLTAPFRKDQSFFVCQSVGVPSRKVVCREVMYESKLSMIIPLDMLKLMIKWTSELRDDLLSGLWSARNSAILESLHNCVRHLNSNIEVYTQATEFMDAYIGPSFRPSTEKYRIAFAAVPINLHVQYFQVNGKLAGHFLTCGASAALPLRFSMGGLYRIRNKFVSGLEPTSLDYTNDYRFYARRRMLLHAKRQICELTRRIETEWRVAKFGCVDKVGVEIFSEVKQLHETMCDLINSFPNISNLVDALCEDGYIQLAQPSSLTDSLSNQLDTLDAAMISLTSKMAVIDSVNDNPKGRDAFEDSAKSALNFTLDTLMRLVESVSLAQVLSLVVALRRRPDCESFFSMQLRHDLILSHTVTIVSTAILTALQDQLQLIGAHIASGVDGTGSDSAPPFAAPSTFSHPFWRSGHDSSIPPLVVNYFSFLSCYGDERGMMEDIFEIWSNFYNYVQFRFVASSSAVSQTCIPQIDGYRTDLRVCIPLSQPPYNELFSDESERRNASPLSADLPEGGGGGHWFRVRTIAWNIGINQEATLACSIGDVSLEETVNRSALNLIQQHVTKHYCGHCASSSSSALTVVSESVSASALSGTPSVEEMEEPIAVQTNVESKCEDTDAVLRRSAEPDADQESSAQQQQQQRSPSALSLTGGMDASLIHGMLADLKKLVNACPSRKNVAIFPRVVALVNALGGINVISCKSGKDRTALAVTLEEGRLLKETCGIAQQQMSEIVDCLRRDGVRRENCRKNIGKALYSFSPFQMHFLPKEFRPPDGTFAAKIAS